ncbi:MAG: S4 domain-containing protein, partial [Planctomycetota bacterium]
MALFPRERDLTRAPDRVEIRVDASDFGLRVQDVSMRLDAFLVHHLKWRSRSSIQTLVKDGFVLVDGSTPDQPRGTGETKVEKRTGRKLRHGSLVVVIIPPEHRLEITEGAGDELEVLYEDDDLLAVDKPPFLPVHPSGRHLVDTLIQRVHARTTTE